MPILKQASTSTTTTTTANNNVHAARTSAPHRTNPLATTAAIANATGTRTSDVNALEEEEWVVVEAPVESGWRGWGRWLGRRTGQLDSVPGHDRVGNQAHWHGLPFKDAVRLAEPLRLEVHCHPTHVGFAQTLSTNVSLN